MCNRCKTREVVRPLQRASAAGRLRRKGDRSIPREHSRPAFADLPHLLPAAPEMNSATSAG